MGSWFSGIRVFFNIVKSSKFKIEKFATSHRFLREGLGCKSQPRHKDMQFRPGPTPAYLMVKNTPEMENGLCVFWLVLLCQLEKKQKTFQGGYFKKIHLFYYFHLYHCLPWMRATCRIWVPLQYETFFIKFYLFFQISSYQVPLSCDTRVASQLGLIIFYSLNT